MSVDPSVERPAAIDPWSATRRSCSFDVWDMPFVGNGYLGLRVAYSGEGREIEDEAWYSASVMCAGLMGDWSRDPARPMPFAVQLPNFLHFEPSFHPRVAWRNDPWVEWEDYRQTLGFRHSTVDTSYRMRPNGWRIRQRVWAHRVDRHLVVQEMHVEAGADAYDMTTCALNPLGQWKNYTQGCELVASRGVPEADAAVHRGAVPNTGIAFAYAERLLVSPQAPAHRVAATAPGAPGLAQVGFQARVPGRAAFTIVKLTAFCDSRLVGEAELEAFVLARVAGIAWDDLARLRAEHEAAWDELWERVPEFDHPPVSTMLPAAAHALFANIGSGLEVDLQICGLSNARAWMGQSFEWDQSVFVFPALMAMHPAWTRDLLAGHLAKYAVRRDLGIDVKSNGSPAFAMAWFRDVTGDAAWFRAQLPRLRALMDNLLERADFNPALGRYEIRRTHPADERGPLEADNDIWTNAVNAELVRTAIACARACGEAVPDAWRALDERGFWLPFNEERQGYIEYATWTPQGLVAAYDGHERKQADVELAYFPLGHLRDLRHLRNDVDFYVPRITTWGAPQMQNGWLAAIECILGRPERALGWLERSVAGWFKGDFRIVCEMQENRRGLFTTGAGDFLDGVVYGLLGARVHARELRFVPALCPEGVRAIRARRLHLCGSAWSVDFALGGDGGVRYRIEERGGAGRSFTGAFRGELRIDLAAR